MFSYQQSHFHCHGIHHLHHHHHLDHGLCHLMLLWWDLHHFTSLLLFCSSSRGQVSECVILEKMLFLFATSCHLLLIKTMGAHAQFSNIWMGLFLASKMPVVRSGLINSIVQIQRLWAIFSFDNLLHIFNLATWFGEVIFRLAQNKVDAQLIKKKCFQ